MTDIHRAACARAPAVDLATAHHRDCGRYARPARPTRRDAGA